MSPRRRISRQTSKPSIFGSIRSRITRSGSWRAWSVERLLAVAGRDDAEALLLEVQPEQVDDVALVVDDQDRLHRGGGYAAARRPGPV